MTKHKHAELMALYAQDAMKTDEPWTRWEYYVSYNKTWEGMHTHPSWYPQNQYRRKPKTSRERFEEWYDGPVERSFMLNAWLAWQEAERQTKESK